MATVEDFEYICKCCMMELIDGECPTCEAMGCFPRVENRFEE